MKQTGDDHVLSTDTTADQEQLDLSAQLVGRARGLVDLLAERAPEAEALGHLSPAVLDALGAAELLALGPPRSLGGHGVDIDTIFEIGYELGRGCTSTAWCWQIWTLHAWFTGHMTSGSAVAEIFANGPSTIIASGYNPQGAIVEVADGGCMLSGRWRFSSGVDHADWLILGADPPGLDRPAGALNMMLFVPRDQVAVADDWNVLGLKGTGSKSVSIEEPIYVPESRYLDLHEAENRPGRVADERASYRLPVDVAIGFVAASPFIGAAQAIVDGFCADTRSRTDSFTGAQKSDSVALQMRIGQSGADAYAALRLGRAATREMLDLANAGQALTAEQRARLRMGSVYVVELARRSAARLFEVGDTSAMFAGNDMLRRFCDIYTGSKHFSFRWDELTESYGRVRLGLPPSSVIHEISARR
jgi:3-hydroxy-9,10-secoandrosta-1,3,5(10)-triene-9,17-dione monooxygenase